ncbi:tyrosine-type recombinase/integrase [Candidatus Woesearchaeota archaeon]|nr:tyrosine-type recombinase/integrase [Candidatus Woesearchaeota archaeon]
MIYLGVRHLAKSGINDLILQSLMGHSDIKSTYRYTHGNINMELKSPLDELII